MVSYIYLAPDRLNKSYSLLSADVVKLFDEAWGEMKGDCVNYFRWTDLVITEGSSDVSFRVKSKRRSLKSLCRQIGRRKWRRLGIVTKNSVKMRKQDPRKSCTCKLKKKDSYSSILVTYQDGTGVLIWGKGPFDEIRVVCVICLEVQFFNRPFLGFSGVRVFAVSLERELLFFRSCVANFLVKENLLISPQTVTTDKSSSNKQQENDLA